MKTTTHYKGHRWSTDEIRKLMDMWSNNVPIEQISSELNSTHKAILTQVQRLRKEGVPLHRRKAGNKLGNLSKLWTQSEVDYLMRRRNERATNDDIARELGRTWSGVQAMIYNLRKQGVPIAMRGAGQHRLYDVNSLKSLHITLPESKIIEMDSRTA